MSLTHANQPHHVLSTVNPGEFEHRLVVPVHGHMSSTNASPDDSPRVIAQVTDPQPPEKVPAVCDVKPVFGLFIRNKVPWNALCGLPDVLFTESIDLRHKLCAIG